VVIMPDVNPKLKPFCTECCICVQRRDVFI
jgi:hypothetical protein